MTSLTARKKLRYKFMTTLLILIGIPAYAVALPDSGTALEGAKQPTGTQMLPAATIAVAEQPSTAVADKRPIITVNSFRFSGDLPVPAERLRVLTDSHTGKMLSLYDLNVLADKLTQYLRQQGYLVAYAYIPAQDVKDANIEISVIAGTYGQININNKANIPDTQIQAMLTALKPGKVITRQELERYLLLLNDLGGIAAKATLHPGTVTGTADLAIDLTDTKVVSGNIVLDNQGNSYTGKNRAASQVTIHNLTGSGDNLQLGGLTTGNGIYDFNLAYRGLLASNGATWEIKRDQLHYKIGKEYAALNATGQALVTSYSVTYPFMRSRTVNLYGSISYDKKHLRDDVKATDSYSPKTIGLWNLSITGNFADTWLGGGINSFNLTCSRGNLTLQEPNIAAADAISAKTAGTFGKSVLSWQRRQYLGANLELRLNAVAQLATKNLNSSEKLFLGGASSIRAYPQGEAAGDEGYYTNSEIWWQIPEKTPTSKHTSLILFYDYGSVRTNKQLWSSATEANQRTLAAIGVGINWLTDRTSTLRLDYAWKAGSAAAVSDSDQNGRLWVQYIQYF